MPVMLSIIINNEAIKTLCRQKCLSQILFLTPFVHLLPLTRSWVQIIIIIIITLKKITSPVKIQNSLCWNFLWCRKWSPIVYLWQFFLWYRLQLWLKCFTYIFWLIWRKLYSWIGVKAVNETNEQTSKHRYL